MSAWKPVLAVLFALAAAAGGAQAQTRVQLVETFPPGPEIVVPPQQDIYLRIAYETDRPVHIWARPYYRGKKVDAGSSTSPEYSGKGELLGFFFLFPPGGQVDEIRVTAGDGSRNGTPEIARWPVRVFVYSNAESPPPEPAWVVTLREAQKQATDAAMRAQASQHATAGDMAIFSGFMLVFVGLGIVGLAWPAWALWQWRGRWRKWAAVPLAVLGFVLLRIAVDTAGDPTSHNLWPFEVIMAGGFSLLVMVALVLLRRVTR